MNERDTENVVEEVLRERRRQEQLKAAGKFLWSCSDDSFKLPDGGTGAVTSSDKLAVLSEEFGEAAREVTEILIKASKGEDPNGNYCALRKELIQVAAVCVAWVESLEAYKP